MYKVSIAALLAFLILLVVSCSDDSTCPCSTNKINIGILYDVTDQSIPAIQEMLAAVEIARDDMDAYFKANNMKYTVSLFLRNSMFDSVKLMQNVADLVANDCKFIIGPYSSADVMRIKSYVDTQKTMVLSYSAVAAALAIPNDNIYRLVPSDTYQAEAIVAMLLHDGIKVICPVVRGDVWGKGLFAAVKAGFEAQGGVVYTPHYYPPTTQLTVSDVNAIEASIFDGITAAKNVYSETEIAIFAPTFGELTTFLNNFCSNELYESVRWYGASAFAQNPDILTAACANEMAAKIQLKCPIFGFNEAAKSIWEPLLNKIAASVGHTPGIYPLAAYDALKIAATAYAGCGDQSNFELLKTSIVNTANSYSGATGPCTLDENGDRSQVTYDFWMVVKTGDAYKWQKTAVYDVASNILTLFK
jgi:branched-chain amino acid transport system substrate-binding protein